MIDVIVVILLIFNRRYVVSFLITVTGTGIGVYLAFLADRYNKDKAERIENDRILNLIRTEVNANKEILEIMKNTTAPGVPNTRPMRDIWDGLTGSLGSVKKANLLSQAVVLYYLLANLDGMLDAYQRNAGEYQYGDSTKRAAMEPILTDQCKHFTSYIKKHILPQIDKVLTLIDTTNS
jgi:hypothetical protein